MHDESLFARVPCQARHGRNRLVEPAGFEPATFPLRTGCAASAPRPHAGPHLCADRLEKESFGWRRYAAGALGRIRTGDAHLRRVALYPLSYGAGGGRLKLGLGAGRLDSIPLIRAPGRKATRRSAPAFALLPGARVLRLRACATAAGMLQHSSVFHGTSCVPTCPRPDSNRRRPPPEDGTLSAELRWHMPPPRDDARKRPPVGGMHIGPPVLAALAGWRLFHPSDGVLRAFHADAFDYPSNMTGHRIPLPISRGSANCGRAPRGIRTHNPRLKRTLL